jgi:DNA-directed RNA polymerase II subunit RPB1
MLVHITQIAVISNYDNDDTPIIHIRFDMIDYNFDTIIDFQDMIFSNFKIKGMNGVHEIYIDEKQMVEYDPDTHKQLEVKRTIITVGGENLKDIRNIKYLDINRCISNDVVKTYTLFGIEAARNLLVSQYTNAIEKPPNYHHISLLADIMTRIGILTSIDRNSLNKIDTEPLGRASFERVIEQFTRASMFGEKDSMQGVSARIITGQMINSGTGVCDLMMDIDMLENSEYVEKYEQQRVYNELTISNVISDVIKRNKKGLFIP